MIMRAGVIRQAETADYRINVYQWLNTTEEHPPAQTFCMQEVFEKEPDAEAYLTNTVLPDLRKMMKAMRESLPMMQYKSGRLKPGQIRDAEQGCGHLRTDLPSAF
jgi:hypothetical protein